MTLGTTDSSNNRGVIRSVIEAKTHPDWNVVYGTSYDADIAIIKLDRPVEFSNKIRPICMPKSFEKVFEVTGWVAGYGVSNDDVLDGKLRFLKIPTVTQEKCLWHSGGFATTASNRTFCGGDLTKSACENLFDLFIWIEFIGCFVLIQVEVTVELVLSSNLSDHLMKL